MSRIGKLPIHIPEKVKLTVNNTSVKVEGPKGTLEKTFNAHLMIQVKENCIIVTPSDDSRFTRAMQGTTRSIIANMVQGVIEPYIKDLIIEGVGFKALMKGNQLELSLGYSHPIHYTIPEGINITIQENTKLKITGIDKQLVGEVASSLQSFYKPEPYKGKGVHIVGKFVRRKEGKTVG